MENQNEVVDYLWQIGWFKKVRKPKGIQEKIQTFGIYSENITPTLKLKKFKKKIKRFKDGWKEIRAANIKGIKKTSEFEEISSCLGDSFKKEMQELKIVMNNCSNCTAFLMRKILEKLLFIVISKSDRKEDIKKLKEKEERLPNLTKLLNLSKNAEINNMHIISPKNINNLEGSKFLGDVASHDYLTDVSFEDIKQEISVWRISIKELSKNLS